MGTPVRAVLFDLDGTLVDSEPFTDLAILEVMARHGFPGVRLPPSETRGRTWEAVCAQLIATHRLAPTPAALADEMLASWMALARDVQPIPGAREAIRAASASQLALGVVSSSPRSVIDAFLARIGVADHFLAEARIGAESVRASKPDPQGYLLCASRLGAAPHACVVFEDSRAGLLAARAAGMRSVLVLHSAVDAAENRALADASCFDFTALPSNFFAALAAGALELGGRSYP